jgi:hypothetical protein
MAEIDGAELHTTCANHLMRFWWCCRRCHTLLIESSLPDSRPIAEVERLQAADLAPVKVMAAHHSCSGGSDRQKSRKTGQTR